MLTFNDLLKKADIEPKEVLLMRHTPQEPKLRRVFPWLAAERPDLYNAYQSFQPKQAVEKAVKKAKYLASFIGLEGKAGLAHFVGIYEQTGAKLVNAQEYWEQSSSQELLKYGMSENVVLEELFQFHLESVPDFEKWRGQLIIEWNNELSWHRKADKNPFLIHAILEDSAFEEAMPLWDELVLTRSNLQTLSSAWKATLKEWSGIYLIIDKSDGRAYVGSAYGENNLLGRWENYAETGHGGNAELNGLDYSKFRFSILERVSPDAKKDYVIKRENRWKERLHTREFGLNSN